MEESARVGEPLKFPVLISPLFKGVFFEGRK
jgi:hypothetical protein